MKRILASAGFGLLAAGAIAAPTVTVSGFDARTGNYTVSIGERSAKTWLFAVAADEDKGEAIEGWDAVSFVGEYDAGAPVDVNRMLPRSFTASPKTVRFIAADLPGTRVECLTSSFKDASNGSYVDTGIVPDKTTDITVDCKHTTSSASFGVVTVFYLFGNGSSEMFYGYFGPQASTQNGGNLNQRNTLRLCPEGGYKDGERVVSFDPKSLVKTTDMTATLFARRQNATAIGKAGVVTIWSASMSTNGVPARDYVPYADAEGNGFLFDRVTKTSFPNKMPAYPFTLGSTQPPVLTDATAFSVSSASVTTGELPDATVSDLTVTQEPGSHRVKVSYALATEKTVVVTARMLTNGVAVANARLVGDANVEVDAGSRAFYWYPDDTLPTKAAQTVKAEIKVWSVDAPPAYIVFDVRKAKMQGSGHARKPRFYEAECDLPDGIGSDRYRTDEMVMRRVNARGAVFRMGSPVDETVSGSVRHATGEETRYVTFTEDFYMGVFEFTQGQFLAAATNANPSAFCCPTDNQHLGRPLEKFSYNRFHSSYKRSEHPGHGVHDSSIVYQLRQATQAVIDLPTEAQWEFACRAGTGTPFHWGSDSAVSHSRNNQNPSGNQTSTWQGKEATCTVDEGGTARVGSYPPNAWGFYDMSGNVWEMCVDSWSSGPFDQNTLATPLVDPIVETSSSEHVRRGGGWGAAPYGSRSATRSSCQSENTGVGFRLVCPVPYTKAWEK